MKFSKLGVMFAAATIAAGAFADAANVLVSFSTEADYYADGTTPVANGEWYALCWSPRETFSGLTLDCTPVKADEKVLILAPLAKDGHCPSVVFQVDSEKAPKEDGYYFVYVLDTRNKDGSPAVKDPESTRRVPATTMNGAQVATKGFTASASFGGNVANTENVEGGVAWSAVQPKITKFGVVGDKVNITVTGVLPGIQYKVRMGKTVNDLNSYSISLGGTGTVEFKELDAGDAKFFTVIGQ